MVKTRRQRSMSSVNTPSPSPLHGRTRKKKNLDLLTSQDDMFSDSQTPRTKESPRKIRKKNEQENVKQLGSDDCKDEDSLKGSSVEDSDVESAPQSEETLKSSIGDVHQSESEETLQSSIGNVPVLGLVSIATESDDEAPEDVSFNQSRQSALERVKHALEGSQRSLSNMKEKRRARDKLFKEQKKEQLKTSRLSADLLRELAEEETISQQVPQITETQVYDKDEGVSSDESEDSSQQVGIHVTTLPRQFQLSKTKSQVAADFLQQQLYGSRVKRQSVNAMYAQKRKLQGKAAFKFRTASKKAKLR